MTSLSETFSPNGGGKINGGSGSTPEPKLGGPGVGSKPVEPEI